MQKEIYHKMKFNQVILVFTLVIVLVMTSDAAEDKKFIDCKRNEWIFTNTSIVYVNDTKHITTSITSNEPERPIYEAHIMIDDCKNHTFCSGKPRTQILNVNCSSNNLSEDVMDVCKAAQEVTELEKKFEWLIIRYGLDEKELFDSIKCLEIKEQN